MKTLIFTVAMALVAGTAQAGCFNVVDAQQGKTGQTMCIQQNDEDTNTVNLLDERGEVSQSLTVESHSSSCHPEEMGHDCGPGERQVCLKHAPPKHIVSCLRFGCCKAAPGNSD